MDIWFCTPSTRLHLKNCGSNTTSIIDNIVIKSLTIVLGCLLCIRYVYFVQLQKILHFYYSNFLPFLPFSLLCLLLVILLVPFSQKATCHITILPFLPLSPCGALSQGQKVTCLSPDACILIQIQCIYFHLNQVKTDEDIYIFRKLQKVGPGQGRPRSGPAQAGPGPQPYRVSPGWPQGRGPPALPVDSLLLMA